MGNRIEERRKRELDITEAGKETEETVETVEEVEKETVEQEVGMPLKLDITIKETKKRKSMAKTFWLKEDTAKGFKKLAKHVRKSESQLLQEILENVLEQSNIK